MTGFSEASIAPIRTLRAAELRLGERRAVDKGRAGSYWLLLVFVFLLYLNLPVVWPGAELIHPAKIVAGLALITLLGETMFARGTFELGWPEGGLLIGFLGIAWVGIFANPNDLAYSLVILVPIAASLAIEMGWLGRLVLVGMSLVYMAGVYVTFARGCLIGLLAVIALIAWKQRSMVLKALIILALCASMVFAGKFWSRNEDFKNINGEGSFQQRLATSEAGLSMFLDHPLLGVGPACSVVAWPLYAPRGLYTRGALVTHNTFIQALSETGALGFIAFMAFMGLSSGNVLTWFPYILVGMVTAARQIKGEN